MVRDDLDVLRSILKGKLDEIQQKGSESLLGLSSPQDVCADPNDRASYESDRNFVLLLRERDREMAARIEDALARFDEGSYGICDECGDDIALARLKAQPTAMLCVHCQALQEESGRPDAHVAGYY
ncbi:TraR/DksA family transcriptional regulator [Desulfovibrio inopinatus]|uniref:TraR/DksA family transcriptional regulator n=1 Tax=Desulfovibrio inopinatus TaxID=102109 RepID=UPI00040D6261|nr:TraR/DksA family transcriptional regulator [Desulfovibrio inopinatus]